MSRESRTKQTAKPTADFSTMPDFARAIRGLARVPKKEVDDAIAKERAAKKKRRAS